MRYAPVFLLLASLAAACAMRSPALPPLTQTRIQDKTGHPARPPDERPDGACRPAPISLTG